MIAFWDLTMEGLLGTPGFFLFLALGLVVGTIEWARERLRDRKHTTKESNHHGN